MKTILAVWHSSNMGKTQSIRQFTLALLNTPSLSPTILLDDPNLHHPHWDFFMVIEANGKKVGIASQGDPKSGLQAKLTDLATNHQCDVIVCSSRTRGATVKDVEQVANSHHYDIIWTSTYQAGNNHRVMNQLKGQHMLDLLVQSGRL